MDDAAKAIEWNKRGIKHFSQEQWSEAVQAFHAAIDARPDFIDAYYNLGLALNKDGQMQQAVSAFQALLELAPKHVGGLFHLGCLRMQRQDYQGAVQLFLQLLVQQPEHVESLVNAGSCYLCLGLLNEASAYYLKALVFEPADTQILFNLGVISIQQGRVSEAIQYYLAALKVNPAFYDAHNNIAVAYLMIKDHAAARRHFCEVLKLQPHDEAVRHTIDILSGDKSPSQSPPAYIRALFDSYADHFDTHLKQALHYQVPRHLLALVQSQTQQSRLTILDLGCGTGLTGELFKPCSNRLVGVDLSRKMLKQAREKQIYDELVLSEVSAYLADCTQRFDLIVSGDVLVYFGNLDSIFINARQVLLPQGLFAFNLEMGEAVDYQLTESGRFVHNDAYVRQVAQQHQWQLLKYEALPMRVQEDKTVRGHFYLFQRM